MTAGGTTTSPRSTAATLTVRVATGAAALTVALLVALAVAPDRVGLHGTLPFVQLVALRGLVAAGLIVTALVLVAVPRRRRLLPVTAVLLIGAGVELAVLADRGLGGELGAPEAPEELVVLTLNTQDALGPDVLGAFVAHHEPDVVVLPETLGSTARGTAEVAGARGLDLQVLSDDGPGPDTTGATGATAMLVDRRLGTYRVVADHPGGLASFTATSDGSGPPLSAVHPYPPLPGSMSAWREESAAAVALCAEHRGGVVAGDLNATVDHPAFDHPALDLPVPDPLAADSAAPGDPGGCVDAAVAAGEGAVGTWPVGVPAALGAAIDHVLVDGGAWRVLAVSVLEPPAGTDHRALLVRLAPAR